MVSPVTDPDRTGTLFLLAVTGSLGCGKSRVSRWLAGQGAHLLDADQDARAVLVPGSTGWQAVLDRFGMAMLAGEGPVTARPIDRRRLGETVFQDPQARLDLEAIVHPRIYQRQAQALTRWQQATPPGTTALVVAEVPLLFEADCARRFDRTAVVLCGATQTERLRDRGGMAIPVQQAVIARQLPEQEKQRLAHHAIDNSGAWPATEQQLQALWSSVCQQAPATTTRAWPHHWPESRTTARGEGSDNS
ncbi:MAG: dephospho-CoA kinase [Magnetococcus sp. DMHC-8]